MKNLAIATIAFIALSLASCKKDYTCECNKVRTSNGNTLSTHDEDYKFTDSRTRAESKCNDQEKTGSDALGDYSRECQIK